VGCIRIGGDAINHAKRIFGRRFGRSMGLRGPVKGAF